MFIRKIDEHYECSASFGVKKTYGPIDDFQPEKEFISEGQKARKIIPLCKDIAFLALFSEEEIPKDILETVFDRKRTWETAFELHSCSRKPEYIENTFFQKYIYSEVEKRKSPFVSIAVIDIKEFVSYMKETRPSSHADHIQNDLHCLTSMIMNETGAVFLLTGTRLLLVHFSRHRADPGLLAEQLVLIVKKQLSAFFALTAHADTCFSINIENEELPALEILTKTP